MLQLELLKGDFNFHSMHIIVNGAIVAFSFDKYKISFNKNHSYKTKHQPSSIIVKCSKLQRSVLPICPSRGKR